MLQCIAMAGIVPGWLYRLSPRTDRISRPWPIAIYVDACLAVAERHALKGVTLKVLVVSNSPNRVPRDEMIERVDRA
jgi:hypothetical protein